MYTPRPKLRAERLLSGSNNNGEYADGTDGQTDGRQTVTLRFPLETRPV